MAKVWFFDSHAPMKKPLSFIKTLDRIKVSNLAGRLIRDIERIIPPDTALFQEAVIIAGAPEATQSLNYLPFNRQVHADGDVTTAVSLVVLFNNLRMERFFLSGFRERVSRPVLNPPRGKPRGSFTVRIKRRFSVRSLTPPQAAGNALAVFERRQTIQKMKIPLIHRCRKAPRHQ